MGTMADASHAPFLQSTVHELARRARTLNPFNKTSSFVRTPRAPRRQRRAPCLGAVTWTDAPATRCSPPSPRRSFASPRTAESRRCVLGGRGHLRTFMLLRLVSRAPAPQTKDFGSQQSGLSTEDPLLMVGCAAPAALC